MACSVSGAGKTGQLCVKQDIRTFSHAICKINPKLIKDLDVRPETIKFLEENSGKTPFDINRSNVYFGSVSYGKRNKSKNKQKGPD